MPWAAAHHDRCKWARRSDRPHVVSIERAANTPNGTYGRPAAPKICGGEAELLGGDPTGGQTPQVDGELAGDRDDDFLFACRAACRGEERLAPLSERVIGRSEEHTSELQSPCNLACRLLIEKNHQELRVDGGGTAPRFFDQHLATPEGRRKSPGPPTVPQSECRG